MLDIFYIYIYYIYIYIYIYIYTYLETNERYHYDVYVLCLLCKFLYNLRVCSHMYSIHKTIYIIIIFLYI